MSSHSSHGGSDMGAAFAGLIGGAIFIGAVLYGIVVLTNGHFESEKAAHKAGASVSVPAAGLKA
ncbi:MAG: hypothetical protein IT353_00685 [Gemmatimonadaceae bacterium]|nr:hypothetical protein [Gemmatimonadaceae bacterium]